MISENRKIYNREYSRKYRAANRDRLLKNGRILYKKYYQDNKEKILAKSREHYHSNKEKINEERRIKRIEFNEWWIDYKSTLKCERCSESFWYCLDFHHKDSENKENMVSKLLSHTNKAAILEEISKCIVLCSNCHRKEHYDWTIAGRGNSFAVRRRN